MKLSKKFPFAAMFIVLGLFVTLPAWSVTGPGEVAPLLKSSQGQSVVLFLNYQNEKDLTVTLRDESSVALLVDEIEHVTSISKMYVLEALPAGDYYFEVEDAQSIFIIPVKIYEHEVRVIQEETEEFFKPQINVENGKVYLNMLLTESLQAEIQILDRYNEVIHQEEINDKQVVNRVFDISKAGNSQYRMIILANGRRFYYDLAR